MRMKSALTRALVLSLVLLGALAAAPTADAGVKANHSGNICKNFHAEDATQLEYLAVGIWSLKKPTPANPTGATYVVCPLTRNTSNSNGALVYVDIMHYGTQTTACGAWSYDYTGAILAGNSQGWTGSGFYEFTIDLRGDKKSSIWGNYGVFCTIPGNKAGLIYDVDLDEQ